MRPGRLDREVFARLSTHHGENLLSLVLPTHRMGPETETDRIRLKNLIKEADDLFESGDWKPRQRAELLDPIRELLDDIEFWQYQQTGLGVFLDDDGDLSTVSLPRHEAVSVFSVGPVFHVRHLMPSLELATHPVLALTKGAVAMYRSGRNSICRVEADLPRSMDDVNWFVDREAQIQRHSEAAGSSRLFHGHDPSERAHEDVNRFLRAVSDAVTEAGELIVVGDDKLVARFASIHRRPVISPPNSGVFDADDSQLVHGLVASVIAEEEDALAAKAAQEAMTAVVAGAAMVELEESLAGAVIGRIAELVLWRKAEPRWGRWDHDALELVHSAVPQRVEDVDLLDRLVVAAVETGAWVRTVSDRLNGHDFVAIPRF